MIRFPECARSLAVRRQVLRACTALLALEALMDTTSAQPVSPAETLLFETDHLARTKAPATLTYDFRKVSNVEAGFTDTVELGLTREGGRVHARLRFLSGERQREVPDIDDVHGNPVLLGFLERDIAEMKRLTGGSTTYFRKRIRMALAQGAQLTRQPISFQGKTHDARVVRIQPYLDDPLHARFEQYVRKTYTFVLSEEVPGGVYRIATSLGNEGGRVIRTAAGAGQGAEAPAIDETLTLVKAADRR
jgi:hypothetical protein